MSRTKLSLSFALTTLMVVGVVVFSSGLLKSELLGGLSPQPANAQVGVNIDYAGRQVYQQLPNLPLENKYVSKETGQVAEGNTLVNRLIRYHVYVKGRAPLYRLDWKLTLADYLGANEIMYDTSYPGNETLRQNPLEGDRAIIERLNRTQRDALVQVLVNIFNPNSASTPTPSTNTSSPQSPQPRTTTQPVLTLPKPGDAELLK